MMELLSNKFEKFNLSVDENEGPMDKMSNIVRDALNQTTSTPTIVKIHSVDSEDNRKDKLILKLSDEAPVNKTEISEERPKMITHIGSKPPIDDMELLTEKIKKELILKKSTTDLEGEEDNLIKHRGPDGARPTDIITLNHEFQPPAKFVRPQMCCPGFNYDRNNQLVSGFNFTNNISHKNNNVSGPPLIPFRNQDFAPNFDMLQQHYLLGQQQQLNLNQQQQFQRKPPQDVQQYQLPPQQFCQQPPNHPQQQNILVQHYYSNASPSIPALSISNRDKTAREVLEESNPNFYNHTPKYSFGRLNLTYNEHGEIIHDGKSINYQQPQDLLLYDNTHQHQPQLPQMHIQQPFIDVNLYSNNLQKNIDYAKNINNEEDIYSNNSIKDCSKTLPSGLSMSKPPLEKEENLSFLEDFLVPELKDTLISTFETEHENYVPHKNNDYQKSNPPPLVLKTNMSINSYNCEEIPNFDYDDEESYRTPYPNGLKCFADEILDSEEDDHKINNIKEELKLISGKIDMNANKSNSDLHRDNNIRSASSSINSPASEHKSLKNVDIAEQDVDGDNILHRAVIDSDFVVVNHILNELKYDDNLRKIVLEMKNNLCQTPLSLAVISNQSSFVKQLIDLGADTNTNIISNCRNFSKNGVNFLKPLHFAASKGHLWLDCLRELLASSTIDVDAPNSDGKTPLICAIQSHGQMFEGKKINSIQSIEFLVKNGASINKPDSGFDMTPLHHAISAKSYDLVNCIVGLASCNTMKRSYDSKDCRNDLIKMMNSKTGAGYTALHLAASIDMSPECDHLKMIQLLLSKGADPSCKNSDGQLARELTRSQKVVELLKGLGMGRINRKMSQQAQQQQQQQYSSVFLSPSHSSSATPSCYKSGSSSPISSATLSPRNQINMPLSPESSSSISPSSFYSASFFSANGFP